MSRAEDEGMQGHAPWLADPVQSETPAGLLPVSARGKHEIEAAGGWVVACGAYDEYGCMPTEARDYIVATLNARAASQERPPIDVERLGWVIYEMGIDDLNLPDAEKLAAHILSRLSGSVGE